MPIVKNALLILFFWDSSSGLKLFLIMPALQLPVPLDLALSMAGDAPRVRAVG